MSRFGALILSIFGSKGVVYHAKGAIKKVTIFRPGLKRGGGSRPSLNPYSEILKTIGENNK